MNKEDEIQQGQIIIDREGEASALHIAVANSFHHLLKWLIEVKSVNINSRSIKQDTPLHTAADLGLTKAAKYLIENGADLNLLNANKITPLMTACGWGKKQDLVALQLIEADADIHYIRESDYQNALSFALRGSSEEVINSLIKKGAVDCTPAPEVLEQERQKRKFPRLIKEGRIAFKNNEYEKCIHIFNEAKEIQALDKLSSKYYELAGNRK